MDVIYKTDHIRRPSSSGERRPTDRSKSICQTWADVISSDCFLAQARKTLNNSACPLSEDYYQHSGYYEREEPPHSFCIGSKYQGEWNSVGMWGHGNYTFPYSPYSRMPRKSNKTKRQSMSIDWDNVVSSITQPVRTISHCVDTPSEYIQLTHPGHQRIERTPHTFCTDSVYTGQWNMIDMTGFGSFKFCHDVEYEGEIRDGMFHGEGTLTYPMGSKIDGEWVKGKLVSFKYRFADELEYDTPWKYCKMPDRRFYTSIQEGLRPAGRSLLTNQDPPREIPEGCYDTGDGFYNPITKCVMSAIHPEKVIRVPTTAEEKWIMENCRKAWDEPTGYRPDLYEHWVSGRKSDLAQVKGEDSSSSNSSPNNSVLESPPETDSLNMIVPPSYNSTSDASYNWWEKNYDSFRKTTEDK